MKRITRYYSTVVVLGIMATTTIYAAEVLREEDQIITHSNGGSIGNNSIYARFSDLIQEVKEESLAKGMAEGIAKGMATRTKEIAINLLKDGMDDNMVMRATKLTLEDLEELKKSL
jgi:predicted transposase/invertase (TIGR01784 family)